MATVRLLSVSSRAVASETRDPELGLFWYWIPDSPSDALRASGMTACGHPFYWIIHNCAMVYCVLRADLSIVVTLDALLKAAFWPERCKKLQR